MTRILVLVLSLFALSANAVDLEKWVDKMIDKDTDNYRKEQITILSKEPDAKYRIKAAEWLSSQHDPDSVTALAAALSDKDARVRKEAASQLWSAEERAKPYQAAAHEDARRSRPQRRRQCRRRAAGDRHEARRSSRRARKRVLAAPDASTSSRFYAARNLVGYEAPMKLVGPMIEYLERNTQNYTGSVTDKSRKNVELAEKALAHLVKKGKDRAIIQPLFEALVETKNGQIPLMKTLGLFDPKPDGWTNSLIRQLDNPNPNVRYEALGQLRTVKKEKDVARVGAARGRDAAGSGLLGALARPSGRSGSAQGLAASEIDKVVAATQRPGHVGAAQRRARAGRDGRGEPGDSGRDAGAGRRGRAPGGRQGDAGSGQGRARRGEVGAAEHRQWRHGGRLGSACRGAYRPAPQGAAPASTGNEAQGLALPALAQGEVRRSLLLPGADQARRPAGARVPRRRDVAQQVDPGPRPLDPRDALRERGVRAERAPDEARDQADREAPARARRRRQRRRRERATPRSPRPRARAATAS